MDRLKSCRCIGLQPAGMGILFWDSGLDPDTDRLLMCTNRKAKIFLAWNVNKSLPITRQRRGDCESQKYDALPAVVGGLARKIGVGALYAIIQPP